MPGPNTTGVPNTKDYNLGRGIVYFAALDATSNLPTIWRDLGNCPAFKVTSATNVLDHFSSRAGLKVLDEEVVIEQTMTLNFELDELNDENLALLFAGNKATYVNPSIAGFTNNHLVADGNLQLGRWYDIQTSDTIPQRAYDCKVAKITLTTTEGSPVTMVSGTDYKLDLEMGRIFILPTSTVAATAIAAVKGLKIIYAADATAKAVSQVQTLTSPSILGAVKFISSNPANANRAAEYQFHAVSMKATGDFNLVSDTFTTMVFDGKAQLNPQVDSASQTLTIRSVSLT